MIICRYWFLLIAFFIYTSQAQSQGFLKAQGPIIVNQADEKVILRGMGLGGWMLQEGYMLRVGSLGQQHRIKEKIAELVGSEKTEQFYDGWLANHTRKIDIDSMAAWGFNSVRIPMHFRLFTLSVEEEPVQGKNTWLDKGFVMLDSLLSWCKANKIYLILDLHATPGGQGNDLNISDRDPAKPSLWDSEANQQKMIDLWKKLAERYAKEPFIGGYDIINEPNWGFEDPKDRRGSAETKNAPLRKLMMDITAAIRTVDKQHIIIIEGNGFGNNYRGVLPPWDDNMVLSFHKYGNFNTEASIRSFLDLREKYNIPLWMGESGENSNTWYTEAIRLVETHDIGWSWWPLKKMGNNNPLEIKVPRGYQRMLDYWANKGPKPTPRDAAAALDSLLVNVRLENNSYHKDVIDAMFRQVYSDKALPYWTDNTIEASAKTFIPAVGYDLGRQGIAYFDRDSARYQYTPGVKTDGNKGHVVRNDGVDIYKGVDSADDYIFSIEDGEWLQYTMYIKEAGKYQISLRVSSGSNTGSISLYAGDKLLVKGLAVPNTGDAVWTMVRPADISLPAGTLPLRVVADKGGFVFSEIVIWRRP